jgi:hypothetical protein
MQRTRERENGVAVVEGGWTTGRICGRCRSEAEVSDVLRALDMGPHSQSRGIDYLTFLAAAFDWATCVSKPKLEAYVADAFNMCVCRRPILSIRLRLTHATTAKAAMHASRVEARAELAEPGRASVGVQPGQGRRRVVVGGGLGAQLHGHERAVCDGHSRDGRPTLAGPALAAPHTGAVPHAAHAHQGAGAGGHGRRCACASESSPPTSATVDVGSLRTTAARLEAVLTRAWEHVMRDAGGSSAGQCGCAAQACLAGAGALHASAVPRHLQEGDQVVAPRVSSPLARRAAIAHAPLPTCGATDKTLSRC